jgi:ATP-dependent Clp protease ATP-binding subunit ClpA
MTALKPSALSIWTERDLLAAAADGSLLQAFCVEETLQRVCEVIRSGKAPVLIGDPGVGKTAIVHELARRVHLGSGPEQLRGCRIVQLSIRYHLSTLTNASQLQKSLQSLVTELTAGAATEAGRGIVPFFRDMHLALRMGVDSQLEVLAQRLPGPVIGEAEASAWASEIEDSPELEQEYVALTVREPTLEQMEALLLAWRTSSEVRAERFRPEAVLEALRLTDRFLSRTRHPRKSIDLLKHVDSLTPAAERITRAHVIDAFHESFHVPRFLIDPTIAFDVARTERALETKVLGQREAVRAVVRMVSMVKAGLSDARRPLGAFLFTGPTGVGKTHLAQLLAEMLFGSRDRVLRVNMADHQAPEDAQAVFGNPHAYTLSGRRGLLTNRLLGHPFAVLLLDEFEKASEPLLDRFFQLIDEGTFINGAGETLSCRSVIVIATTNAGAEVYRQPGLGFTPAPTLAELDRELDRRLLARFRHEFLNRFDHIVHFHPLDRAAIRQVALREVEALRERSGIRFPGLSLEVDDAVLDWLAVHGYDAQFGARYLKRVIERNVTTALAECMVGEQVAPGSRLSVFVRGERILARLRPPGAPDLAHMPAGSRERPRPGERIAPAALVAAAEAWVARGAPILDALDADRVQSAEMLAGINAPGFWDDPVTARVKIRAYRTLELAMQLGERVRAAVSALRGELAAAPHGPAGLAALGRDIESARRHIERWERRRRESGAGSAWLLIHNVDVLTPAVQWLEELVDMECAWCRRLDLDVDVIAHGVYGDQLTRAVLHVSGPGAEAFLKMEHGTHRAHRSDGPDLRVRMHSIPERERVEPQKVSYVRSYAGLLGQRVTCAGTVERVAEGERIDLLAADPERLGAFLADLTAYLEAAPETCTDVARLYGYDGTAARDPRTGAVIARARDVQRGKLDALLDAYRLSV